MAVVEDTPARVAEGPGEPGEPGRPTRWRIRSGWFLAALAAVTVLLGIAIPFAPVTADDPVVSWPKAGEPASIDGRPPLALPAAVAHRGRAVPGPARGRRRTAHRAGVRGHPRARADGLELRRARHGHQRRGHPRRRGPTADAVHVPRRRRRHDDHADPRRPGPLLGRGAGPAGRPARHGRARHPRPVRHAAPRRPLLVGPEHAEADAADPARRRARRDPRAGLAPLVGRTGRVPAQPAAVRGARLGRRRRQRRVGGALAAAERRLVVPAHGPQRDADGLHGQPDLHVRRDGEPVRRQPVRHGDLGPPREPARHARLGPAVDARPPAAAGPADVVPPAGAARHRPRPDRTPPVGAVDAARGPPRVVPALRDGAAARGLHRPAVRRRDAALRGRPPPRGGRPAHPRDGARGARRHALAGRPRRRPPPSSSSCRGSTAG